MAFLPYLHRVSEGEILSRGEAYEAMSAILEGNATSAQIAGFLVAIRMRGEVAEEIVGFAQAMRARMRRVEGLEDLPLIDTCGTGGDGVGTFNISTVAAIVLAGAGLHVAKHGNRSASGTFGSADLLEALGAKIDKPAEDVARDIREKGFGFLFAPAHHPAMMHARAARVELKMRTVFNLLGPLTNPAGAPRQLIGAPSEMSARLMAEALVALGSTRAFVVHSVDGLDEISTTGSTIAFEVHEGRISRHLWEPSDFGVPRARLSTLIPFGREENVSIAHSVLRGDSGPHRDVVLVNAAAALVLTGRARDFRAGMIMAGESIDSGEARRRLELLQQV
jgi:anthranilate phosphoribosyltransferase